MHPKMMSIASVERWNRCERVRTHDPTPRIRITNPKTSAMLTAISNVFLIGTLLHLLRVIFHFLDEMADI